MTMLSAATTTLSTPPTASGSSSNRLRRRQVQQQRTMKFFFVHFCPFLYVLWGLVISSNNYRSHAFAPHPRPCRSFSPSISPATAATRIKLMIQQQQQLSSASRALSLFWQDDNDNGSNDDSNSDFFSRFMNTAGIIGGDGGPSQQTTTTTNQLSKSGRVSTILLQAQSALAPAADVLQEKTDGWALSYADLTPESEQTPIGQAFLATNIAYAMGGAFLGAQGESLLAFMLELVSVASFAYHYTQLAAPYNRTQESTVQLALMVDYIFAFTSIFLGLIYLLSDQTLPPIEGIASSTIGIACLLACWKWEKGMPYIYLHSLWHIFSAISAYIVGTSHLAA